MEERLKQIRDSWNERADSAWYQSLRTDDKIEELVKEPANAFHPGLYQLIRKYIPDLRGKKVLLPSSGDNHAAFAFALLGAEVTSADISERQLEHAREIADRLNLSIRFVCDDTTLLSEMEEDSFDLVYTSNGTHTWIADIGTMYKNIYRVLKSAGHSIMFDVHPFQRPFAGEPWKEPELRKPYEEVMPHCHWRVQDLVNAMTGAGLSLKEMQELQAVNASFWFSYQDLIKMEKNIPQNKNIPQKEELLASINDWKHNPMAALPAWISIVAQK